MKEKIETYLDLDVLQSRLFDSQKSTFRRYQTWISRLLSTSIQKMGKNVIFGRNVNARQPNKIELGDNDAIADDNCDLYLRGNNGRISIGNNVLIDRNTIIPPIDESIKIGGNTLVSMNCVLGCWEATLKLGGSY